MEAVVESGDLSQGDAVPIVSADRAAVAAVDPWGRCRVGASDVHLRRSTHSQESRRRTALGPLRVLLLTAACLVTCRP